MPKLKPCRGSFTCDVSAVVNLGHVLMKLNEMKNNETKKKRKIIKLKRDKYKLRYLLFCKSKPKKKTETKTTK